MNQAKIYDDKISPLMKQIIEICTKNGIEMIANFSIQFPEHDSLGVLTFLPSDTSKLSHNMREAVYAIRPYLRETLGQVENGSELKYFV